MQIESKNQVTESRLQSEVYTWFHNTYPEQRGQLFMIYNNPKNAAHGAILKAMGMVAGCSDLIYLAPTGKVYFLECKLPEGVQSKDQKKFENMVSGIGHTYRIFRSVEQFQEIIKTISMTHDNLVQSIITK
jgi:hypothetical protein